MKRATATLAFALLAMTASAGTIDRVSVYATGAKSTTNWLVILFGNSHFSVELFSVEFTNENRRSHCNADISLDRSSECKSSSLVLKAGCLKLSPCEIVTPESIHFFMRIGLGACVASRVRAAKRVIREVDLVGRRGARQLLAQA